MTSTNRYTEVELEEFRVLLQGKLDMTKSQLEQLQSQIYEIAENSEDEHGSDWMDDSHINNEIEILNDMAIRQRKYVRDIENALVRIKNKTYGICVITGELIDKKRLLAVPITTKSIAAKNAANEKAKKPESSESQTSNKSDADSPPPKKKSRPTTPIIIDKVIRKSPSKKSAKKPEPSKNEIDELDIFNDLNIDEEPEIYPDTVIDPDTISSGEGEPEIEL